MSNSIEIFQNTLLQLIVRQGTNSDRLNVILKSGELGYTTDTKKLYVGDGVTLGGSLIGKTYAGSATNITTLAPSEIGDLAFDSDNNNLYRLKENSGSNIGDWELIGGVYGAADSTISISPDNKISVGSISATNISVNSFERPIFINGSNQIALSARIPLDEIIPKSGDTLKIPSKIQIGANTFTFSSVTPLDGQVFYINGGEVTTSDFASINNAVKYTPQILALSSISQAFQNLGVPSYSSLSAANSALDVGRIYFDTTLQTLNTVTA